MLLVIAINHKQRNVMDATPAHYIHCQLSNKVFHYVPSTCGTVSGIGQASNFLQYKWKTRQIISCRESCGMFNQCSL